MFLRFWIKWHFLKPPGRKETTFSNELPCYLFPWLYCLIWTYGFPFVHILTPAKDSFPEFFAFYRFSINIFCLQNKKKILAGDGWDVLFWIGSLGNIYQDFPLKRIYFKLCTCVREKYIYESVGVHGGDRRSLDHLDLELSVVVNVLMWVMGTEPMCSAKALMFSTSEISL